MGLVKTIYNVLGGFYVLYNNIIFTESVHKLSRKNEKFSYIFDKRFLIQEKSGEKVSNYFTFLGKNNII